MVHRGVDCPILPDLFQDSSQFVFKACAGTSIENFGVNMRTCHLIGISLACSAAASAATGNRRSAAVADTTLVDVLANAANANDFADTGTPNAISTILSQLQQTNSTASPDSPPVALSALEHTFSGEQNLNILDVASKIAEAGLVPPEISTLLNGYSNSELNAPQYQNPAPKAEDIPIKKQSRRSVLAF